MHDPGIHWQERTWLSTLLLPIAWLYCLLISIRRLGYRSGVPRTRHLSVPVIVVGNVTVGGTGKTPLVIWLADLLRQQGWRPGIVTRGYGGQSRTWPVPVTPESDPAQVGDEPVLLARHAGCPVVAGPDRIADATALLQQHACDVIISDDGLQHYRLGRDIEIAVIDGQRRFGNGRCLPAGPLREPVGRLRRVQARVVNGDALAGEIGMRFEAGALHNLRTAQVVAPAELAAQGPVHAVAGIGHPARFFQQLRTLGFIVIEHAFADHHPYRPADIDFAENSRVVMTEKDAVKCQAFANARSWVLAVEARPDVALGEQVLKRLKEIIRGQEAA